jgi:hypothetical protein
MAADSMVWVGTHLHRGELQRVLNQYKVIGYRRMHDTCFLPPAVSRLKGDLHKELYYKIGVVKCMQATADTTDAGLFITGWLKPMKICECMIKACSILKRHWRNIS